MERPYLSVVAVSRNDDHGGDPLRRTRLFINSLAFQAERYTLPVELILVDWNPPEGKPPLADVLDFPVNAFFTARVIVVPPALHESFRHGDELPLFQMIGKNAGIRRAAGEFILATNIDILLDDSLFEGIAQKNLDPRRMYRADRYDIDTAIPEGGHEARQAFCRDTQNHVRRNHRLDRGAYYRLQEETPFESSLLLSKKHNFSWGEFTGGAFPSVALKPETPLALLNNNACGDFTLLHRDAWTAIRGYGEFEAWSFNIDSIGCMQAHAAGFPEVSFLPPLVCYHVEHAPASGWTPEHGEKVFERIVKAGIPYLEWNFLNKTVVKAIRQNAGAPFVFNDERWGLRDFDLAETVFAPKKKRGIKASIAPRDFRPFAAILPFWHVDTMLQNFLLDDDDDEEVAYSPRQAVRHLYIAFVPRRIRLVLRKMRGKG